ncbi:MAG TPA: nucleotidyltransferase [Porphyromonadaceae bacterium]|jgi:dTDP-glucose pyrophosphorylase|nr:nucleotidyltransferase [Porphyromonadaceae bacterium]HBX18964.1 nucleotidyltransferase [Porphyromonadaceae bacterium]
MKEFAKYLINEQATVRDALIALNALSDDIQTLFVISESDELKGTITDGDIRRGLIEGITIDDPVLRLMHTVFKYIKESDKDVAYIKQLKKSNIELLPCLDEKGRIIGIYNLKKLASILPVDAVMMAGGRGERLRPLTEKTPKPLLPLGGKPIIDHNVDRLINYGVRNISVTVNYLGEQIIDHFKSHQNGANIHCIKEPEFLGTIGSVQFIDTFVNDTILVMNSDLFTNIDYEEFYLHFLENDADVSVAAIPYSISVPYGIFELEERNILGIKEKPVYNYYANAGIYLIKKKLLKLIPKNTYCDATDFIEMLIANNHKVIRFPLIGYWIDIGKHEDYKKAQEFIRHL